MKRTFIVALGPLLSLLCPGVACSAPERLRSTTEEALPLREVSGLARGVVDGAEVLLAVGDEARAVTVVPLVKDLPDLARAREVVAPLPVEPGGSQLEGVAIGPDGHVWLLTEGEPPRLTELAIHGDQATLVSQGELVVPPGHELQIDWARKPNARGEGLVVEADRILVAKQKDPVALIAFHRDGARWVAGEWWSVAMNDLSDLARGPDGELYAVGADSQRICRLQRLTPNGGALRCEAHWSLPEALGHGEPRWEGLAFLASGAPVVAVDRKKSDTPNLAVLPLLR